MKRRSRRALRGVTLLTVMSLCISVTSCTVVPSVAPWFDTGNHIFDAGLLGVWSGKVIEDNSDDHAEYTLTVSKEGRQSYTMNLVRHPGRDEATSTTLNLSLTANLGRLGDCYFMDVRQLEGASAESEDSSALLYLHNVVRLELHANVLTLWKLEGDRVRDVVRKHQIPKAKVEFLDDDLDLIHIPIAVSETSTLQDFLINYGRSSALWIKAMKFKRE